MRTWTSCAQPASDCCRCVCACVACGVCLCVRAATERTKNKQTNKHSTLLLSGGTVWRHWGASFASLPHLLAHLFCVCALLPPTHPTPPLQGSRMRNTKTEYVSCPSCGRTLFDLQEVTEQIRTKTGHLPGERPCGGLCHLRLVWGAACARCSCSALWRCPWLVLC